MHVCSTAYQQCRCCTYDNRGIGHSSIPQRYAAYRTRHMAADALALMGHLGWDRAHVLGMSLGGMVGCRLLAAAPHRVASLTMLSTTLTGCAMAATTLRRPWITLRAGQGPLRSRIPANLRANFSPHYLAQHVNGRTRKELLTESTWEAIRLGLTEKFLAEGQPAVGKNGHVLAVLTHRLSREEVSAMRRAGVPLQMINGRHDVVAGLTHVQRLARRLACPLILTEGAHAGICLETPGAINAAMERIIGVVVRALLCVAHALLLIIDPSICTAAAEAAEWRAGRRRMPGLREHADYCPLTGMSGHQRCKTCCNGPLLYSLSLHTSAVALTGQNARLGIRAHVRSLAREAALQMMPTWEPPTQRSR